MCGKEILEVLLSQHLSIVLGTISMTLLLFWMEKTLTFLECGFGHFEDVLSTDENDQSYQGRSLNVQNPKKPLTTTATKHFMSPTISAASKANPPRRKILAESNGSLDTHLQKTPTFGSKTISSIEFAEYGENVLLDNLSVKAL
uniref:Uncharacterized protein n=1 Tax=Populus alba TaxID=43335 RepID=A0A4V6A1E1_POPAL|nr:hypothetical protein D5086_0000290490 [Populus alba]